MKLALALLLLAAPLSAQTATKNIVVNVVVTLVKGGASTPAPITTPTPVVTTPPVVVTTPNPVTTSPTPITSVPNPVTGTPTACVNNYPGAVTSMASVTTALAQAQQIYSTALSQNAISADSYASAIRTLSLVSLDNADVRDLIRIDGPASMISQNITFVSAEIGTLPGLLGSTSQLKSTLTTLATAMQASLGVAGTDVAQSTCPQAVP